MSAGQIKWQYQIDENEDNPEGGYEGSPAISQDNTIYVLGRGKLIGNYFPLKLYAIVDAGNEGQARSGNWPFGDYIERVQNIIPVVTVDERILINVFRNDTRKYFLYALSSNGEIAWQIEDFNLMYPPAAALNGKIYTILKGPYDWSPGKLVKLSSSGVVEGEVALDFASKPNCSPVVGPDGRVYLLSYNKLFLLDLRAENPDDWVVQVVGSARWLCVFFYC